MSIALAGDIAAAADSMSALEHEGARAARYLGFGQSHPFFSAINRLLAARWMITSGDTIGAESLLRFHEATFPPDLRRAADANAALAPLALLELAHIAEARGRIDDARALYADVMRRMDAPAPALRPLLPDPGRR
jgi:hypothetical protein